MWNVWSSISRCVCVLGGGGGGVGGGGDNREAVEYRLRTVKMLIQDSRPRTM